MFVRPTGDESGGGPPCQPGEMRARWLLGLNQGRPNRDINSGAEDGSPASKSGSAMVKQSCLARSELSGSTGGHREEGFAYSACLLGDVM
jgi:hypothetical protein